jgi:CheY-specific phosphatase CheX
MNKLEEIACTILQESWTSFFGVTLNLCNESNEVRINQSWLTVCIDIIGANENHVVYVSVPVHIIRTQAANSFGMSVELIDDDMLQDMMGEISNQVAGQIKTHFNEPSLGLSLPIMVQGDNYIVRAPNSETLFVLKFCTDHSPIIVKVLLAKTLHEKQ